jgi:WD40 repeat protein
MRMASERKQQQPAVGVAGNNQTFGGRRVTGMNLQNWRTLAMVIVVLVATSCATNQSPATVSTDGPPQVPILRLELGMHSSTGQQVGTDGQGRFIITCSLDKTARLWDASSGQLLRVYRVPSEADSSNGFLYACALSPDGSVAAMGGLDWEASVYLFDRQSGQMIKRLSGLGNTVFSLQFTPDGEYLAAVLGGKSGCAVWSCRDWSLVGTDENVGDSCYRLDFVRRDGAWTMATSSYDSKIRYYRLGDRLEKLLEYDCGTGAHPLGLSFNPDGSLLAVGYKDPPQVQVLSVSSKQMTLAYAPDLSNCSALSLSAVRFSSDGESLYAGGSWMAGGMAVLRMWGEGGKGPYHDVKPGGTDSILCAQAMPGGGLLIGGADPFWSILDVSGKVKTSVDAPIIAFWRENAFKLGPDARTISFNGKEGSSSTWSFDTATRSLALKAPSSDLKLADTKSLRIENWRNRYNPSLDGKPLLLDKNEVSRSLAIAPGSRQFVLGAAWSIYSFNKDGKQLWKTGIPDMTWSINVSSDGRLVVAALGDGTLRWYRLTDGQELLTLYPNPDGKRWVLWTPSGYYDASPGGEDLIGWQINNGMDAAADFFPAAHFRGTYYRPDVINLVLATLDEGRALSSANSESGRRQDSASILSRRPPIILITSPDQEGTFSASKFTMRYRLRTSADAPVTSIRALVDGRPMEGARGLNVVAASDTDQSLELDLPSRDCTVSLIAENKNGPSEAASVRLLWKGSAAAQEEFVIKPMLYVLSVGVSDYQKPEYRLTYAATDAHDFAALLNKGSPLYRGVQSKVLTDAQANKVDILDSLEWIQKQTTSKDIAVIFFSGHGINDSNGNYYYLPVEADVDRLKATGVPFSDIKNTVSSIAGKVLFFIDTCHSGNLMAGRRAAGAERDIVGVINELASTENGAVVFASSTGSQYSYEDPAWGNGAFTKALLEGLRGAAAYGQGGRVTVNMLDLYLSERVKQLTGGKQTPTTTKPPNVPDFPIALKD